MQVFADISERLVLRTVDITSTFYRFRIKTQIQICHRLIVMNLSLLINNYIKVHNFMIPEPSVRIFSKRRIFQLVYICHQSVALIPLKVWENVGWNVGSSIRFSILWRHHINVSNSFVAFSRHFFWHNNIIKHSPTHTTKMKLVKISRLIWCCVSTLR